MDRDANFICDASGFKRCTSEMVKQWDGAMVARQFVDRRNPQDFVRGVPDGRPLPVSRPEAPDVFISTPVTPADL